MNEELDIANCLQSVSSFDDVHVLDSGSSDQTIPISLSYGATVSSNAFRSFGQQRNFALDSLEIKNEWVLFLDADEVATPEFLDAVARAISGAGDDVAGFYCCWKMMLEGKWLKYSDSFPKWQFRLLRLGRARFTDFGHGQKEGEVHGEISYICEPYLHYGFSKGWHNWLARHNRYSDLEAVSRSQDAPPVGSIFSYHSSKRNPVLKYWLTRVPGWPLLRFIHAYILKRGIFEGKPGLIYAVNVSYYEFLIQIKMRELKISNSKNANS